MKNPGRKNNLLGMAKKMCISHRQIFIFVYFSAKE